jgi:hypothetical protein
MSASQTRDTPAIGRLAGNPRVTWPIDGVNVPAAQSVQMEAPAAANLPEGHHAQSANKHSAGGLTIRIRSDKHSAGSSFEVAAAGTAVGMEAVGMPGLQGLHVDEAEKAADLPASHSVHTALPGSEEYQPALTCTQLAA